MIKIKLYAEARDRFNTSSLEIINTDIKSIKDLKYYIENKYPEQYEFLKNCAWATENKLVNDSYILPSESLIELLPPVSGG